MKEWKQPKSKLQVQWDSEGLYIRQSYAWNNNGRSKWEHYTIILTEEEARKVLKVIEERVGI